MKNTFRDTRAQKTLVMNLLLQAAAAVAKKEYPNADTNTLASMAQGYLQALKPSQSYIRIEDTIPAGGISKSQFVFDPSVDGTGNSKRAAFYGLTKTDIFFAFAEDLRIDARQAGQDANADLQSFPNPLHFTDATSGIYAAGATASVKSLNAVYSAYEKLNVSGTDYIPDQPTDRYWRVPEATQGLTPGVATASQLYFEKEGPLDLSDVLILNGEKKTAITVQCLQNPAIVVPTVAGSELVVTKQYFGWKVPQGNKFYDAIMGIVIGG